MLMSAMPDYYRILHVQPDAPLAIIHASYRTLQQRMKNGAGFGFDGDAALLEEAYAVIGDVQRRAAYDLQRDVAAEQTTAPHDRDPETLATNTCLFCAAPHGLQRAIDRDDDCSRCASPLYPAERHRLEYSGQRMLSRIPKQRDIEIYVTWPQSQPFTAKMRDLSLNGMQFTAGMRLHQSQIVKIRGRELEALGRVAHSNRVADAVDRWTTGVEFLTLRFRQSRGTFVSAQV